MSDFGLGPLELLSVLVVWVVPAWRIVAKAGYAGAWALLVLVPVVNVVAYFVFAFSEWPVERRGVPAHR